VAPSEPTIRRTVKSVDADEADVLVGRWLAEQVRAGRLAARQVPTFTALALDGKTLKGSWAEVNTGSGKVRLFSALVHREGVVVGQRTIPADTNELAGGRPAAGRRAGQIGGGYAASACRSGTWVNPGCHRWKSSASDELLERRQTSRACNSSSSRTRSSFMDRATRSGL